MVKRRYLGDALVLLGGALLAGGMYTFTAAQKKEFEVKALLYQFPEVKRGFQIQSELNALDRVERSLDRAQSDLKGVSIARWLFTEKSKILS